MSLKNPWRIIRVTLHYHDIEFSYHISSSKSGSGESESEGIEADKKAIANDWRITANHLRSAMKSYAKGCFGETDTYEALNAK